MSDVANTIPDATIHDVPATTPDGAANTMTNTIPDVATGGVVSCPHNDSVLQTSCPSGYECVWKESPTGVCHLELLLPTNLTLHPTP